MDANLGEKFASTPAFFRLLNMSTEASQPKAPCCDASGGTDRPTAVDFATQMRIHVALVTRDVAASTRFYERLFEQAPTKVRDRYAKFELAEPPLNLSLNEFARADPAAPGLAHHLGIQVKSTRAVERIARRMMEAGLEGREEEQVACCYAVQDKIWFTDPDGHQWEIFVVTDAESSAYAPQPAAEVAANEDDCCPPVCCT